MKRSIYFLSGNFIALLILTSISGCTNGNTAPSNPAPTTPATAIMEEVTLQKGALPQLIKLPGQLASFEEVSIFPKVNGYVKDVWVDVGSHVKKGQLLMQLEAPEMEQAVTQARERYARARLDYTISRENYERMHLASETPGAVSPMNLASLKAKADADSTLCNAEKANWQMQETMLGYLKVTAPFDGVIAERNVHPGALVSATGKDKPMLDLHQVNRLRLQVDIPESIAAGLQDKDTVSFYLSAYPGRKMIGHVSRRSELMNSQYRAERMELDVPNPDRKLTAGMYADVLFYSKGNPEAFTVPRTAVVTSTERKYVVVIRNGRTVRVDVSTGNETAGKVEITGNLRSGEQVLARANDEIPEGTTVK